MYAHGNVILKHVTNRHGNLEPVDFEEISRRIQGCVDGSTLGLSPLLNVNVPGIVQKTIAAMHDGILTVELDRLIVRHSVALASLEPEYDALAVRMLVTELHRKTPPTFSAAMEMAEPLLTQEFVRTVRKNAAVLDAMVVKTRDYMYDNFGLRTLLESYVLTHPSMEDEIVETPQYMLLRVAVALWGSDMDRVREYYEELSAHKFTHASPTMFNAGTRTGQLSSCFLVALKEDSIEGIYDTLKECALISKVAGGIGLHVSNVRSRNSRIRSSNGKASGLAPMLKCFESTGRYVDQGGGKRRGAIGVYLEPWHADIYEVLTLRENSGSDDTKCRDLFFGLWTNGLFMRRVKDDGLWSLFSPSDTPDLVDAYDAPDDDAFTRLYERYEAQGLAVRAVRARDLMTEICRAQIQTGTPYMLYKDACNWKSNQRNLGTIRSSNLCSEIIQYSDPQETAVCNLASIALPRFCVEEGVEPGTRLVGSLRGGARHFDHAALGRCVQMVTRALDRVIDVNVYPTEPSRRSNMRARPMGIGVQGLADTFEILGLPWKDLRAQKLNREIFETMYYNALSMSCTLAEEAGAPYDAYEGSPASKGLLQPDMWSDVDLQVSRWDWPALRERIRTHGLRNSLLVALMPTASTSQILGNSECIEPRTSHYFVRNTKVGEFVVPNKNLIHDLAQLGMWNEDVKREIIEAEGSVATLSTFNAENDIHESLRRVYKTVWEVPNPVLVRLMLDRAAFVDQHQSFNVYDPKATSDRLGRLHMRAFESGAKGSAYYVRTKTNQGHKTGFAARQTATVKVAASASAGKMSNTQTAEGEAEYLACPIGCTSCGS